MARALFDLSNEISVSPTIWPGRELKVHPGDLTKFAPSGNGFYGYQANHGVNPFRNAPPTEACGGVIYFGSQIKKSDFMALMRLMNVQTEQTINPPKKFAVFIAESEKPGADGYLAQMRIVDRFGLRFMFDALNNEEYEKFSEQKLNMAEALWLFITHERKRWGVSFTDDSSSGLRGLFGGDGDYAREELAFGFMLENDYYHICRIWSRAWLVTK